MAVMKLTAFNGGLKGKIAGTVFQSSPFGQVAKTIPPKSINKWRDKNYTPNRLFSPLATLTAVATSWRTLTDAQRQAWINAGVNFPALNKFGESYTPSGFQLYMSINTKLVGLGLAALTAVPATGGIVNAGAFTTAYQPATEYLYLTDSHYNDETGNLHILGDHPFCGTYTYASGIPNAPIFYEKAGYLVELTGNIDYSAWTGTITNTATGLVVASGHGLFSAPGDLGINITGAFTYETTAGFIISDPVIDTGYYGILSATGPISQGKMPAKAAYKVLEKFSNATVFPFTVTSNYTDTFGQVQESGTIWFKLIIYNGTNAQIGQPYIFKLQY